MTATFKSTWFWLVFVLASGASLLFVWYYFDRAFPLIAIDLQINRDQALQKAKKLADTFSWQPQSIDQAVQFTTDHVVQTFIELEAGGKQAFTNMIEQDDFQPYQWEVRNYQPFNPNETRIHFAPSGKPYGFQQILSEDFESPSLSEQEAQALAKKEAEDNWEIDFSIYQLIDASQTTQPHGRVDHTFVYERTDKTIGKGFFRLRLVVKGNSLTELKRFIKIPDGFTRRYQQMRSANETVSSAGQMAYLVFYLLIGCLLSLFFLLRAGWVIYKQPIIIAAILAFLSVAIKLNMLPLYWFSYHTALSPHVFLLQIIAQFFYSFFFSFGYFLLLVMAAEALTRKAFGNQIQLFKTWTKKSASTWSVLGQTVAGYLWVPIDLAFVIIFYMITTKFFNWWTPLEQLTDPNTLATYFPWLGPIGNALEAGFIEECVFRAIPLAGAAIIGTWLNRRKTCIGIAFVLQAFIFGAVHAGYAAQPAYARLVELIIPSFAFGAIYLLFGLLPGIIYHFIYDAILMSLPLFVSDAPGSKLHQLMVILIASIPLLIIAWRRLQRGSFTTISDQQLNKSWQPPKSTPIQEKEITTQTILLPGKIRKTIIGLGMLGFVLWLYLTPCSTVTQKLSVSSQEAIEVARTYLERQGFDLTDDWQAFAFTGNLEEFGQLKYEPYFMWQENKPFYRQLQGTYIMPPAWKIRYVNFCCPVEESAEEFIVWVMQDGRIHHTEHILPEHWNGAQLSKQEAENLAYGALEQLYHLAPTAVEEIEATSNKMPDRKDWLFTFVEKNIRLAQGQARIAILIRGDQVTASKQFIHVPEKWKRAEAKSEAARDMLEMVSQLVLYTLIAIGFSLALLSVDLPAFMSPFFLTTFGALFLLFMIHLANILPKLISTFTTTKPFANQLFSQLGFNVIYLFLYALVLSVILLYLKKRKPRFRMTQTKWGLGLAGALFVIGTLSAVAMLIPSTVPSWPDYSALASWMPLISAFVFALRKYLVLTCVLSIFVILLNQLTKHGTQRTYLIPTGSLFLLLALFGHDQIFSIELWLITGVVSAIAFSIIYWLFLRYDTTVIALMAFIYSAAVQLQQAQFSGWPGALWTHLLVLFLLGSICWYLTYNMFLKREAV